MNRMDKLTVIWTGIDPEQRCAFCGEPVRAGFEVDREAAVDGVPMEELIVHGRLFGCTIEKSHQWRF